MTQDSSFAEQLASSAPTPGGGAAAARVGRYATSLLRMVTSITLTKSKNLTPEATRRVKALDASAVSLAGRFDELEAEDMAAFEGFLDAMRLPKGSDDEKATRKAAMRAAAKRATDAPVATLDAALETLSAAGDLIELGSEIRLRAESDVGCAVELAAAAFRAAEYNVCVNLSGLGELRAEYEAKLAERKQSLEERYPKLRAAVLDWLK
ncbi:MAG: cyclodeaminase/cyclohydrolase family protein [Planctomycetota bacterium]